MDRNKFYFSNGPYLQALKGLYKSLTQPKAFVTLLGKANTGKSGLCQLLSQYLRGKGYRVVYFHYPIESPEMLRTMLARELDIPESANFARLVEDALPHATDKPVILIFDDAHLLTDVTLLEIYRLAEIQADNRRMLNILLCGEAALEQHLLSRDGFKNLLLNISHRFLLEPMDMETVSQFLHIYLDKQGLPGVEIEPAALAYFWKSCKGFPGPAASICHAVVTAKTDLAPLTRQELVELLQNATGVQTIADMTAGNPKQWFMSGPAAAVVVVASLALMYRQLQPGTDSVSAPPAATAATAGADSPFAPAAPALDANNPTGDYRDEPPRPGVAREPAPDAKPATVSAGEPLLEPGDSSLALVTAAERGIDPRELATPVFEGLVTDTDVDNDGLQVLRLESGDEIVVREPAAAPGISAVPVGDGPVGPGDPGAEPGTAVAYGEDPDLVRERALRRSIDRWLTAWENGQLEWYFNAYHPQFVPRYQDNLAEWRDNRTRVIGNAAWIRLGLTRFIILAVRDDLVEVNFWLAYESPTYSDDTLKQLTLKADGDDWLILEEVNLEVRR